MSVSITIRAALMVLALAPLGWCAGGVEGLGSRARPAARSPSSPTPAAVHARHARAAGVPRRETVQAQLEYALEAKRALRGTRGGARQAARREAAEAYRAVRRYFPEARAEGAEASFRAGELLRSGGDRDGALEEFELAWDLGQRTRFGARAGVELGHTLRRLGRRMEALGWYEAVEALGESWAEERDLGAYWQGRVQTELGRPEDARRCFERAARRGVAPLQRVRAFDAWAGSLIDAGDLEGAAGVLQLGRERLREASEERSTLGLRVRAALEGMRSPGRLARAVARRREQRRESRPLERVHGSGMLRPPSP